MITNAGIWNNNKVTKIPHSLLVLYTLVRLIDDGRKRRLTLVRAKYNEHTIFIVLCRSEPLIDFSFLFMGPCVVNQCQ